MESTLANFSLEPISNEVWSKILMYVPTDTLLRQCRLVSSVFRQISTEICHSFRKVCLRQDEEADFDFESCHQPWSICNYKHKSYYSEEMTVLFPKYGSVLRELKVEDAELEEFAIGCLNFTPNLRTLNLNGRFKWDVTPISVNYVPLLHLTTLCIEGSAIEGEFQQNWFLQLFEKSPLKEISISVRQNWRTTFDTAPFVEFLKNIPSISLNLHLYSNSKREEFVEPFLANCIKVKSFRFYFDSTGEPNDDGYKLVSKLLENTSDSLEKLAMGGNLTRDSNAKEPFKFPVLLKLQHLTLNYAGQLSNNLNLFFSKFSELNVPVLKTFEIRDSCYPLPEKSTTLFQSGILFETVTKLAVRSSHRFTDNWRSVFPNLRMLEASILWEPNEVEMIYAFKHLAELILQIRLPDEVAIDASSLISGIPNEESIDGKTDEEIDEMRQVHSLPCILQLTKLNSLSLEFLTTVALNRSATYTLCQLGTLQKLALTNCTIPEELKANVATKHGCLEILVKENYYGHGFGNFYSNQ